MCLSGGLGRVAIFSKSWDVHSCKGWCCRYVLHASMDGLMVTMIEYMILALQEKTVPFQQSSNRILLM